MDADSTSRDTAEVPLCINRDVLQTGLHMNAYAPCSYDVY